MASPFLSAFADQARLKDQEFLILEQAGVRSREDVDSLLRAFPSIADAGFRVPYVSFIIAGRFQAAYGRASTRIPPRPSGGLGANAPQGSSAGPGATVGSPNPTPRIPAISGGSQLDLRIPDWPVRNQGNRGTCVAFGTTACVEFDQSSIAPEREELSEQFLYWASKDHSGDPDKLNDGTYLEFAAESLSKDGVCRANLCPYVDPLLPARPVAGTPPTSSAIADALLRRYRARHYSMQPAGFASAIHALLNRGRPVAITLPVFADPMLPTLNNWETNVGRLYGRVLDPPIRSVVIGGHCVCVTGFAPDATESNGGHFIFRNSWGPQWASLAPAPGYVSPEVGYGEVSATYIELYGWEAFQV